MPKRKRWINTKSITGAARSVEISIPSTPAEWRELAAEASVILGRVQKRRDLERAKQQAPIDAQTIASVQRQHAMGYEVGRDGEVHMLGGGRQRLWGDARLRMMLGRR